MMKMGVRDADLVVEAINMRFSLETRVGCAFLTSVPLEQESWSFSFPRRAATPVGSRRTRFPQIFVLPRSVGNQIRRPCRSPLHEQIKNGNLKLM